MYHIMATDPAAAEAQPVLAALSGRLVEITGSSGQASFDADDVRGERAVFLLAYDAIERPCGCGALRSLSGDIAEIKRMYAAPGTQGLGARLLAVLEQQALAFGYRAIWLETRRINTRAVDFYLKHGYRVIENYGRYLGRAEAVCFAKELAC